MTDAKIKTVDALFTVKEKEILTVLASLPLEAEGFEAKLRLALGLLSKR